MADVGGQQRDLAVLIVPAVGRLVATGDRWEPYRLVDGGGAPVEAVALFFRELQAAGRSHATVRSYGLDLLRWFRFLWVIEVSWERATRVDARDFCRWLSIAGKPASRRRSQASSAKTTGQPYAASVRAHSETVLRCFYEFHLSVAAAPILVNPFPLVRTGRGGRIHAHHNPMEPFRNERSGLYRPRVPKRVPRSIPDDEFNEIFAHLRSHRDRALVAFYVSTGARASELLSATQGGTDPGRQVIASRSFAREVGKFRSCRPPPTRSCGCGSTSAGQTLTRSITKTAEKLWGDDPETGKRRDLGHEEDHTFWAWAAVEVLRLTGCRVEELLEISHHSLIQYRLPTTGEIVPLLQIVPSKTDEERLLVVSPELADVLSTIIRRIREPDGAVPPVPVYDRYECVWLPPSPLLFQRRFPSEIRAISDSSLRTILNSALAHTGLQDPANGRPLHYSPHDFRRILITDAVMSGLPPHIAQVIAGHRDINVTMGYKAVYPEEAIQAHMAFLTRRRSLRPTDEYRAPTDEEWAEFLGHFERRKVSTGTCGRAFGTPCIHEHACIRCSMLWPDPTQRNRLMEIRDNLVSRIAEAEREGWLGEVEGLRISLAGAEDKLAQLDRRDPGTTTTHLGIPAVTTDSR